MLSSQVSRPSPMTNSPRRKLWLWLGGGAVVAAVALVAVLMYWPGPNGARAHVGGLGNQATGTEGVTSGPGTTGSQTPGPGAANTGNVATGARAGMGASVPATQPAANVVPGAGALSTGATAAELRRGMALIGQQKLVEGRGVLSGLLTTATDLTNADAQAIRDTLASINQDLVFGPQVASGDPLAEYYMVQSGDYLSRIAPRFRLPYQALELINRTSATRLRAGQRLKVLHGPFCAVVTKSAYRVDLFLNTPDGKPIYIRSFAVGLGEGDSTPVGNWVVVNKLANPTWTNPRTGQFFPADDPKKPIGAYWMGLQGTDDRAHGKQGYGLHGTIEPDSIGRQASMGCVRFKSDDIALLYKLMTERLSTVAIEP